MKTAIQNWLDQRGSVPGVLLCGVCLPDRTCLGRSNAPAFPLEQLGPVLQQTADIARGLAQCRFNPTRLRWGFENAQVHWAVRPDNVSLAVLTPVDAKACPPALIEGLVAEFLALRP